MHRAFLSVLVLALAGCAPRGELESVKRRLDKLETPKSDSLDRLAILAIPSQGYSMAHTSHGPIAVVFKNIESLGAGSKITLQFVNMASVELDDVVVTLHYAGRENEAGKATHNLVEPLPPAVGTIATFTIADQKPEDVSLLLVALAPGSFTAKRAL